jgi:hypothetical protein
MRAPPARDIGVERLNLSAALEPRGRDRCAHG